MSDPSVADPTRATQYTQTFQGGRQALYLNGRVYDPLASLGMNAPWLGAPAGALVCDIKLTAEDRSDARRSGCQRPFSGGLAYVSGSTGGMRSVPNIVLKALRATPSTAGLVGWPLSDPIDDGGTPIADPTRSLDFVQVFENARVFVRNGTPFIEYASTTAILKRNATPWLGASVDMVPRCGFRELGCLRHFAGGTVYWSNKTGGVRAVPNVVMDKWGETGYENGALGYPTADPTADPSSSDYSQSFEKGFTIIVSGGKAYGPFKTPDQDLSWLGAPLRSLICYTRVARNDDCYSVFENGILVASEVTQSMYAVPRAIVESEWGDLGREGGLGGMPTGNPQNTRTGAPVADPSRALDYVQNFTSGTVVVERGVARIASSTSAPLTAWINNRWLGAARAEAPSCGLKDNGCFEHFAGGSIYWSDTTNGPRVVPKAVTDRWGQTGWENGALGYPLTDPSADPTTAPSYQQTFQRGTIVVTREGASPQARTGDETVELARSRNRWLGAATDGILHCGLKDHGCFEHFAGGSVYWSDTSKGVHVVPGAVMAVWAQSAWRTASWAIR